MVMAMGDLNFSITRRLVDGKPKENHEAIPCLSSLIISTQDYKIK